MKISSLQAGLSPRCLPILTTPLIKLQTCAEFKTAHILSHALCVLMTVSGSCTDTDTNALLGLAAQMSQANYFTLHTPRGSGPLRGAGPSSDMDCVCENTEQDQQQAFGRSQGNRKCNLTDNTRLW